MFHIDKENGLSALYGGWLLGGGGGGSLAGGTAVLDAVLELGGLDVCTIDEIKENQTVITGSLVGSPSSGVSGNMAEQCTRAYEIFKDNTDNEIGAFITNETGAHSVTNGWIAAAITKLPLIDGACNGRAHPTGVMGALGLDTVADYRTTQVGVGGVGENYLETCIKGSINSTSKLIRNSSIECGGMISVLRNPVTAKYIKENAAIGVLSMCIEIGDILRNNIGHSEIIINKLTEKYGLKVLEQGTITSFDLVCKGGFDVGVVKIEDGISVTFWNEYMTAENEKGERLSTFPDLITLINAETGLPICSANVEKGQNVVVVTIPRENLILGNTMHMKHLFTACEEATGKELIKYIFENE